MFVSHRFISSIKINPRDSKPTQHKFCCHTLLHLQLACGLCARVSPDQASIYKRYGHLHSYYIIYSKLQWDEEQRKLLFFFFMLIWDPRGLSFIPLHK